MSNGVFRAVWTTLGCWREVRLVRIAICAVICGFALPGQAPPSGPIAHHAQQGLVFCGWIGESESDESPIRR
jgi:hypothetical protein